MANSVMMYDVLGYPEDHPDRAVARLSIDKLLVIKDDEAYCQPCVSPVWDTALTAHAMLEAGERVRQSSGEGGSRLAQAVAGARREGRLGGGAAECAAGRLGVSIQQRLLSRPRRHRGRRHGDGPRARPTAAHRTYDPAIARAREWLLGLQSKNGGWGAFDADNNYSYLNNIPFSDHGALLDPPTEDVTARCISMLAQLPPRRREPTRDCRWHCLSADHPAEGWLVVRPLGPELHLRHLVLPLRAQCRRARCQ